MKVSIINTHKKIINNYIYNLIYQIFILVLPFVTTPYVARVLGAENIGIYSYTLSIATYFILFGSLGIATYGQREIAYQQNRKKDYSKTFWELVLLRIITMLISIVIFYISFVSKFNAYSMYFRILLLELFAQSLDISWFYQGLEEFKKILFRNLIIRFISIVCIFLFVKNVDDLGTYIWIYVLSTFFGNISLWFYLPKILVKPDLNEFGLLKHLKYTVGLFIPQIAVQIYTVLDKIMIGTMVLDKSILGYYEQSQKIIKLLLTIVTSLGTVMVPRIANIFAKKDEELINRYIFKSFNFVFLISFPMIFGVLLTSKNFVALFFGQGYEQVSTLMCIISPILLFIGMSNVLGVQFLIPTKRQKEFTVSVLFGAIINFIMNLFLIRKCGAIGASIGTVIAELVVMIIQCIYVRKFFDLKKVSTLSYRYLLASIIMFIICFPISIFIKNHFICLVMQIFLGITIYLIILFIQKDSFLLSVISKLKNRRKFKNEI